MSSYIDFVYSLGDIINKRFVNLISKKVVNKYTEKIQPKKEEKQEEVKEEIKEEEAFVLPCGTYIVIEYGSKHLGNPVRQTTIQIPNT